MENVQIDEKSLYEACVTFGGMCKIIEEEESSLFPNGLVEGASAFFVASILLSDCLEDSMYEAAILSFQDVIKNRSLLSKSEKPIVFPMWDPSQKEFVPFWKMGDVAIILSAWNYSGSSSFADVAKYLKPLFLLSGTIMSGIADGYLGNEPYQQLQAELKNKFFDSLGDIPLSEKRKALKRQLSAIRQTIERN